MTKKIKGKKSTCAVTAQYDSGRQDLKITFPSGKQYTYTPVSEEFATKFEQAKSKGNFFNKHIRNNPALTKLKSV